MVTLWRAPAWVKTYLSAKTIVGDSTDQPDEDDMLSRFVEDFWLQFDAKLKETLGNVRIALAQIKQKPPGVPLARKSDAPSDDLPSLSIEEKLANPRQYPVLTLTEVKKVLPVSRATIYRYLDEGKLTRPAMNKEPRKRSKVLITTTSLKKMLRENPE